MRYRKLGHTGYDVSVIGFGTWQLGGGRWQASSDEESISLLRKARELGVNIFDVAVVYGQYRDEKGYAQSRSQELLGKAFRNRRREVIYCLKLGQFDEYSHRANFDPIRIVEQFQQSLRRLQTDYIDICLVHAPSLVQVKDQKAIMVLKTLRALGLVRAIGYSFENEPEHILEALKQNIDVIMLQYNLLDQNCRDVIGQAQTHGIGILVGGPFKRGYLTGKYKALDDLPKDDYWQWNLDYNKGKVEDILTKIQRLVDKYGSPKSLRKAALECILQNSGASSTIIGHRSLDEVQENIILMENIYQSLGDCREMTLITMVPFFVELTQKSSLAGRC